MKLRTSWLATKLIDLREFFWPLLEAEEPVKSVDPKKAIEIHVANENLEIAFDLKSKIHDSENERRKTIENKASIFISTISITTSIVVASNALISGNNDNDLPIKISVLISFILCIYTGRTVWFSIKALERGNYHVISFSDINVKCNKEAYYKHLITTFQEKTTANYQTINTKVDNITLAQAYYKRAVFVICLYAFLILLFCFFFKKSDSIMQNKFKPFYTFYPPFN